MMANFGELNLEFRCKQIVAHTDESLHSTVKKSLQTWIGDSESEVWFDFGRKKTGDRERDVNLYAIELRSFFRFCQKGKCGFLSTLLTVGITPALEFRRSGRTTCVRPEDN